MIYFSQAFINIYFYYSRAIFSFFSGLLLAIELEGSDKIEI